MRIKKLSNCIGEDVCKRNGYKGCLCRDAGVRPLHAVALEIFRKWKNPSVHAFPYIEAMRKMDKVDEMYGAEYGDMIVARFLGNATHWTGSDARRIKKELKQMLDDYNEGR